MCLIDDDVFELEAFDVLQAYIDPLVGGEAYIKLPGLQVLVDELLTFLLQRNQFDDPATR